MLRKTILTTILSLIFASAAGANEASIVEIQSLESSPISSADVAAVSNDWTNGDVEQANYINSAFNPNAAQVLLEAVPELEENKRALISLTIGLVLLRQQSEDLDVRRTLLNISTHKDLLRKPVLSVKDVMNALTSVAA